MATHSPHPGAPRRPLPPGKCCSRALARHLLCACFAGLAGPCLLPGGAAAAHHALAQPPRSDLPPVAPSLPIQRAESSTITTNHLAELSQSPRIGVWSAWLTNGTRLHAKTLGPDAEPTFSIVITIAGGELLEPAGSRGLADVAASAWSLPKDGDGAGGEIVRRYLESRIRFRGVAHTDALQLLIGGPEDELPLGLELARLLLERPSIDATETARRIETIDAMLREGRSDADARMMDALRPLTLPADMPAARPMMPSDLGALTPERAQEWLRGSLLQGSIEVGIASRLAQHEMLGLAGVQLGALPTRTRISSSPLASLREAEPPIFQARGTITVADGSEEPMGRAMLAILGPARSDILSRRVLAISLIVIDARLEAQLKARLGNVPAEGSIAPARRPMAGRGAWVRTYLNNPAARSSRTVYAIAAATPPTEAGRIADEVSALIDELARLGPLPGELDEAKSVVSGVLARQDRSSDAWAMKLSTLSFDGLGPETLASAMEHYHAVTPDDVRRALSEWWRSERTIRIIVEPEMANGASDRAPD